MSVTLIINGKEHQMPHRLSVAALLALRGLNPDTVVVERNHSILPKESLADTLIEENDQLEILGFVGGG